MNKQQIDLLAEIVHNPAEAAAEHVLWAEAMKNAPGVSWGIPVMDNALNPMHPGEMICLVARPGHCKTSLLAYLARREARRIATEGKHESECVVYVSWEQITEEIDALFHVNPDYNATDIVRGSVDLNAVRKNSLRRVELPVWLIGDSLSRTGTHSVRLTTDVVWQAIEKIIDEYGRRPTLICGDYLQLVPVSKAADLTSEITHAAGMLKELAKRCKCPIVLGVQARQEVDDYKMKIPTSRDGQWASRIFQTCDKWFSLWRPYITDKDGEPLNIEGKLYPITESLLLVRKLKERFSTPLKTWALHFAPQWLKLAELETEITEPNYY